MIIILLRINRATIKQKIKEKTKLIWFCKGIYRGDYGELTMVINPGFPPVPMVRERWLLANERPVLGPVTNQRPGEADTLCP